MISKGIPVLLFVLSAVSVRAFDLSAVDQAAIAGATEGSVVHCPELVQARRQVPVLPVITKPVLGPQLLFSDMPEYLGESNGLALMEDVKPGEYRLYLYHVPGRHGFPKTVSVVVKNTSTRPLLLQFAHCALVRPGMDYAAMGVEGLMQFFTNSTPAPITIAPGAWAPLDPRLEAMSAADPQLVHAFYQFSVDKSARVAVLQRDTNQVSADVVEHLPKFPRNQAGKKESGAGRGIFWEDDMEVRIPFPGVIDSADGVQRLVLADNDRDPWMTGSDALSGNLTVTNKGNYGRVYGIRFNYKSSDGRSLAILVGAPGTRSSGENRPMAALEINGHWRAITATREQGRQRGTLVVAQKLSARKNGETGVVELTYSPPGGSSLPTPIYFVPFRGR